MMNQVIDSDEVMSTSDHNRLLDTAVRDAHSDVVLYLIGRASVLARSPKMFERNQGAFIQNLAKDIKIQFAA